MQPQQDDSTTMQVSGPHGFGAAMKSNSTIVITTILFLVVAGIFATFIWFHEQLSANRHAEIVNATKALTDAMIKVERTQRESTEGVIWILARNQNEREKLDLSKPKFISEMQR